ncbi:acyl carrier protein [Streptomyces niveiscabiei]|uniref:acyl carrier protein n=1 Tax=Streptomyces niveiscabiei TaxID=164115 RepID=UPI0029BDC426|nr:acyl carrier protein [Streptomyces niveiscabiei]MDX3386039.1 acyl carrier protein [Streptomyces niveiscabiei]
MEVIYDYVAGQLADMLHTDSSDLSADMTLEGIGVDSLILLELSVRIDGDFGTDILNGPPIQLDGIGTLGDLVRTLRPLLPEPSAEVPA